MRFAHIADTHIRNLKYHFEYREVFKQLYNSIKESNVDFIVHCGDIAHTKTQISPEFVELCTEFFKNLASIAETVIILGNHDGNLRNSTRQDAITPIVQAMENENIHLIKRSGEVWLNEDFSLYVLSCFDDESLWPTPVDDTKVNIAMYHGAISKSRTDKNWSMFGDHNIEIFDPFDFAFLGDIHKTQKLDKRGTIRYAGSTVQQNFGESLDKGYLLWDIQNKENFTTEHITFENPKPFITIPLTTTGRIPKKVDPPRGARLRLVSENNLSLDRIRRAVSVAKHRFNPESLIFLNRAAGEKPSVESAAVALNKEDLRDIKVQEKLIKEYLKDFEVNEDVLRKVFDLNSEYNTIIEQNEEVSRNVNWTLKSLEWDYLFNYGEGNKVDFEKLNGIVGIFGKNFSGKSSIVDSLLYGLFNSSSKSIRRNLNIINQNSTTGYAKVVIGVGDRDYIISRRSEKYKKKLHGQETLEAKTDLDFLWADLMGNESELNGLSRQDTDKKIRKVFGTIDDFLTTSMSSQLGSLTFINEGSTKRKEILAKFLDLETFERKYRMAKEESQETKISLHKLEGVDYDKKIDDIKFEINRNLMMIENNKLLCEELDIEINERQDVLRRLGALIASIPSSVIDPVKLFTNLSTGKKSIKNIQKKNVELNIDLVEKRRVYHDIVDFLDEFDFEECKDKKARIEEKKEELSEHLIEIRKLSEDKTRMHTKVMLLREVPCGDKFPTCKFIKDAHASSNLISITEHKMSEHSNSANLLGEAIEQLQPKRVDENIENYLKLVEKKNKLASEIALDRLIIEQNESKVFKQELELESIKDKLSEYDDNKEAIEGLKTHLTERESIKDVMQVKQDELSLCEEDTFRLFRQQGSLEEKLERMRLSKSELNRLTVDFAAYDLFMNCCHANGISYEIIKKKLPLINDEIAKILTNIVEFEIFIEDDGRKLDIFIKHPKHNPRPLELGSGAEKTIASMAIRLAFLTVSTLPKSDVFILDEPGTALDEENMEGFVRILDMVKSYFKTVVLISHLDVLKDCVDSQIIIEKNNGYAYVNV